MPVCFECYMLSEVSATGRSLIERSPIGCGVFECNLETSIMGRSWLTRALRAVKEQKHCTELRVVFPFAESPCILYIGQTYRSSPDRHHASYI